MNMSITFKCLTFAGHSLVNGNCSTKSGICLIMVNFTWLELPVNIILFAPNFFCSVFIIIEPILEGQPLKNGKKIFFIK